MCGIAGIVMRNEATPDPAVLDALERALAHRGPDGSGRHVNGAVGLLQTRLAIIDLATGDQPLHARGPSGGLISLVANGEIYNYRELRREFPDGTFETQSDCETPLHLYLRDGVEYARGLRGMYAIALHDPQTDRLVLSRDPFGIKPLYYIETGETFAFASEAQALVRAGLAAPNVDTVKARELLQLQFTTGDGLPVAGIKRVLPGETLVIRAGRIIERYRIAALPPAGHRALEPRAAINELMAVLEDSVEMHQRADVPYGMFLSGGIDSSALLAMMDKLNDKPVQAFTVGFGGAGGVPDERDHARAVAKAAHAEHTEIQFGEDDFWSLAPKVAAALDDPVADYAALPTFKLAETVKQAGLKVILSGEGGDEMFAGYGRYRRAARPWILGGRRMRAQGVLSGLGILRDGAPNWRNGIARAEAAVPNGASGLQQAQAIDCADWLPNDLLTKVDRCLMAHGIEGRVPFLDPMVAAFAYPLADRLKVRGRLGKWLLRKWLATALPESQPFSRKRGFTVPVGTWLQVKGARLGPLVAGQAGIQELCRPDTVRALFGAAGKRSGQAQWALLFYALWHQHHIQGRPAEGDAFDLLAA
jgi:asparagine synthase (glutamine-hydrolysing)